MRPALDDFETLEGYTQALVGWRLGAGARGRGTPQKPAPEPRLQDYQTYEEYLIAIVDWRIALHEWARNAVERASLANNRAADGTHQQPLPQLENAPDGSPGLGKVAGMHALKELLYRDVILPMRNPEPYRRYGLSLPNGILLYGPPGCGKTYIARQLAEELEHHFVEVIPSEFASPFLHGGVPRIRDLFDKAAQQAPAVLFIDEFEALVPPREELGGWQQWKAEEVNELLAQLNGCASKQIFVIAATNQAHKIDPAMLRTGRLDKHVYVAPPDRQARTEMLAFHLKDRPVASDLDLGALAAELEYYSASDIRFIVDEAAREAMQHNQEIDNEIVRSALTRIPRSFGPETEEQYRRIPERGC